MRRTLTVGSQEKYVGRHFKFQFLFCERENKRHVKEIFHCLYFLKQLRHIGKLMKKVVNMGPQLNKSEPLVLASDSSTLAC